jgi:hypothetical protein
MQSGELFVTGKDEAIIALNGFPRKVRVDFKGEPVVTPCNPHHHDKLEWEVHRSHHHHGGFILIIKWEVTGVREIEWTAWY